MTSAMLKLTGETSLNKNAVYERITKSKEWLRWLCENLCRQSGQLAERPEWLVGRNVCLTGATDESKNGSSQADYRLHYCVELFSLKMLEMHLTEASTGERLTNFDNPGKDGIAVADRAYSSIKGLEYLRQKGAGFVVRLRSNSFNLYDEHGKKADLIDYFRDLSENGSTAVSLCYKSDGEYRPVRICAIRKSKEAEQDGISKIKKSNSKKMRGKVSGRQPAYNKYIIAATNLGVGSAKILELYRMRWLIELVFKRFKSIFSYGGMPSKAKESIESWFYGKLLVAAICETLVNKGRFSPEPE